MKSWVGLQHLAGVQMSHEKDVQTDEDKGDEDLKKKSVSITAEEKLYI